MNYYAFNIGKPYTDEWWLIKVNRGLISTGFDGEPGDRGDEILHQLEEGDVVLAYANGFGFVGAGYVREESTYKLLADDELPPNWPSKHRHVRGVDWVHAVESLEDGIASSLVDRQAPRQTKEHVPSEVGQRLFDLLGSRCGSARALRNLHKVKKDFDAEVARSMRETAIARQQKLLAASPQPQRVAVLSYEFVRNPDVVAEVLYQAYQTGCHCGRCGREAPFKKRDGTPYLEVHHVQPLAEGGDDTVANAIALCPNCHRELHYGTPQTT